MFNMRKFNFGAVIWLLLGGQAVFKPTLIGQKMASVGSRALNIAEALSRELEQKSGLVAALSQNAEFFGAEKLRLEQANDQLSKNLQSVQVQLKTCFEKNEQLEAGYKDLLQDGDAEDKTALAACEMRLNQLQKSFGRQGEGS